MKIWNSYGSEHSSNLKMIGTFKTVEKAIDAKNAIEQLEGFVERTGGFDTYDRTERFTDEQMELYRNGTKGVQSLSPREFSQFALDVRVQQADNTIQITSDEIDVSAYLKLLIDCGAKVEVYSAHDYPDKDSDTERSSGE